jgi:hypothetical protein
VVIRGKLANLYNELREVLQECSEHDWNGYGCEPVSLEAVTYMEQLLGEIPEELLPDSVGACPSADCTGDYYRNGRIVILFWIEASGSIGWLGKVDELGQREGGSCLWADREQVVEFIRKELSTSYRLDF